MSDEVSVEATGETVGEAKWQAVRELERLVPGLDRERVRFQVVSEGERGLLGVGYTPARVVAAPTRPVAGGRAPAPADESAEAARLRELLELRRPRHSACRARSGRRERRRARRDALGADLGILIGRHGQTIDALQYLANAIAHRRHGLERRPVTVDAAGYRARRSATLEELARAQRRARLGHRPVASSSSR